MFENRIIEQYDFLGRRSGEPDRLTGKYREIFLQGLQEYVGKYKVIRVDGKALSAGAVYPHFNNLPEFVMLQDVKGLVEVRTKGLYSK